MTDQEKLDRLNALPVIYHEGGEDLCVMVAVNELTKKVIYSLGKDDEWINQRVDKVWYSRDDKERLEMDIVELAFECGASYYTGNRFVMDKRSELVSELKDEIKKYELAMTKGLSTAADNQYKKIFDAAVNLAKNGR